MSRSTLATTRNPVLALPAAVRARQNLSDEALQALAAILLDINRVAAVQAEHSWRKRKAPMAAYWRAVSVYSRHIARALRVREFPA